MVELTRLAKNKAKLTKKTTNNQSSITNHVWLLGIVCCFLGNMARPRLKRIIRHRYQDYFYKPRGIPLSSLEVINLTKEELEALRLKNVNDLDQSQCARIMNTSQSTFQRILDSAYKKVSLALTKGLAIRIVKE